MRVLLWLSLLPAVSLAAERSPTEAEQAAVRVLSARHFEGCQPTIDTLGAEADAALLHIAEHVTLPPWTAVRAAGCLADRPGVEAVLARWLVRDDVDGLIEAVLVRLDTLPEARAVAVGRQVLASPAGERLRPMLAVSEVTAVRALVTPVTTAE